MTLTQLLASPQAVTVLVPLTVGLVLGLLFAWLLPRWTGLALIGGFFSAATLIESGLTPGFTGSVNKIMLLGIAATLLGALLDVRPELLAAGRIALVLPVAVPALLAGVAGLWLLWPLLDRLEGVAWLGVALTAMLYPAWLVGWVAALARAGALGEQRAIVLIAAVALTTGAAALLAASARIAQLSLALGVATLALLLVAIIRPGVRVSTIALLPASLLAALLGLAAAGFAWPPFGRIDWTVLMALAAMAPLATLALPHLRLASARGQVLITCLRAALWVLPAVALAVWLVVRSGAGGGSGYG